MKREELLKRISPLYLNGVAHRGLHNEELAENGLPAFNKAIKNGVAFEFDVHLTKDNELVVCHDSDLKRTTGKEGIIEELTLKELKENYTLKDGSKLPTIREVLELNNEKVPMAIELKVYKNNYRKLAKKVVEELKDIKDKSKYFLISFDPRSLWACKKLKLVNGLIVGYQVPSTFFLRHFCNSVDLEYQMAKEKKARRYFKNHYVNVWTVNSEEAFNEIKDCVDTVTFEHLDYNDVNNWLHNR